VSPVRLTLQLYGYNASVNLLHYHQQAAQRAMVAPAARVRTQYVRCTRRVRRSHISLTACSCLRG